MIINDFKDYLVSLGLKETTPKGLPSTVPTYCLQLTNVMKREGYSSLDRFAKDIAIIVPKYDIGGAESKYGQRSHSTVINALKRFQEMIGYNHV